MKQTGKMNGMKQTSRRGRARAGSVHARLLLVASVLSVLAIVAGGATAQAATACPAGANTWTGNAHDGLWGTPSNWSQNNAPGTSSTTEDVCLPDSGSLYTVTLAPFQYINNINNPPVAKIGANSLTIGSGAALVIRGASSNGNYSSSGNDETSLGLVNGGSISAGGTLELLATDDNDGGGASDIGGRGVISGGTLTNAGTFSSASQTTQGTEQSHQNELQISLDDRPGSSASVSSGTLRVDLANHITNEGTWTVASGATMLVQYNGFNQHGQPATSFVNDGSYLNSGATVMNQQDPVDGNSESDPITWSQQGGSVTGNPVQFTRGAELADSAGPGSFLFNQYEGQIAGTIPAGQTVTIRGDRYNPSSFTLFMTLVGAQVVNQGTILIDSPNVSTEDYPAVVLAGSPLVNQGTITSTSEAAGLFNQLEVSLANQHGGALNVQSGQLVAYNGQTVTNDGTITVAPGAQLQEKANPFTSGPETFTNAPDGTIAPQIAGASSFGTVQFGADSTVNLAGTVAPTPVGGYAPALGTAFAVFPFSATPAIEGTFAAVSGGFGADYSHEMATPAYIGVVYGAGSGGGPNGPSLSSSSKPSTLGYGTASVKGSTVRLHLTCSAGSGCPQATIRETIRVRVKGSKILGIVTGKTKSTKKVKIKVLVLASRSVTLKGGSNTTVTVSLNATGRQLLARFHRLRLTVTVSTKGRVRKTFTLTVNQPKASKPKHHKHR